MAMNDTSEPPDDNRHTRPLSKTSLFFIGRDRSGNWVARDQAGLCGGLFVNSSEAVRFAMRENGRHARAVIMVPGFLELTGSIWPKISAAQSVKRKSA